MTEPGLGTGWLPFREDTLWSLSSVTGKASRNQPPPGSGQRPCVVSAACELVVPSQPGGHGRGRRCSGGQGDVLRRQATPRHGGSTTSVHPSQPAPGAPRVPLSPLNPPHGAAAGCLPCPLALGTSPVIRDQLQGVLWLRPHSALGAVRGEPFGPHLKGPCSVSLLWRFRDRGGPGPWVSGRTAPSGGHVSPWGPRPPSGSKVPMRPRSGSAVGSVDPSARGDSRPRRFPRSNPAGSRTRCRESEPRGPGSAAAAAPGIGLPQTPCGARSAGTRWDFGVRRRGERGVPTVPVSRPSVLSCFSSYASSGARERWGRGLGHPRIHLRRRRSEFHSPRVPRTPSLIWGHSDIQDPSRIPGGHPPPRPSRPCGSPAEALYPSPTLRLAAAESPCPSEPSRSSRGPSTCGSAHASPRLGLRGPPFL